MPFSTSDGVRLWTATTGTPTAAPPVVILHGGPGLWDDYAVLADVLDDLTVVHRFDQRGCGRSGPSDEQTLLRRTHHPEGHQRPADIPGDIRSRDAFSPRVPPENPHFEGISCSVA